MTSETAGPSGHKISVSFEFFPPKTEAMEETLWDSIKQLAPLQPDFVSVTYGAGGSTRERTHATIRRLLAETDLAPAAHLTCVGAPQGEIDEIVRDYWDMGVRRMVALRGDPATGLGTKYEAHPEGYAGSRRPRCGDQADRRFRRFRRRLSGAAPGKRLLRR